MGKRTSIPTKERPGLGYGALIDLDFLEALGHLGKDIP